jgi:DnaJ-domain-containing protein 1
MTILIAILILLLFLVGAIALFLRADPVRFAGSLRLAGPLVLMLAGFGAMLAGRPLFGGPLLLAALSLYALARRKARRPRLASGRSMVRTAALEMELDHDTGALEGLVLAGVAEGRMLGSMGMAELVRLYREFSPDIESRQLLETYLDSRFPVWRAHAQADLGEGLAVAPGAGAMTKEEAYKVLGLEAGAAAADVRKAHRRLMQRLHPDVDRASFLAARIDEAKDVLLSDHG